VEDLRVLIVDDSSVMRKMIEHALRNAGVAIKEVLRAGNGAEALSALKENSVDLILCDIYMPVMNGLELLQRLCSGGLARGVPVVMITTEGGESEVVQALAYGASGYIHKPFASELVNRSCRFSRRSPNG
jgi:two-component system, chemotaxis family, chemotaxis protein CheY